jgi:hypothetical protein
LVLSFCFFHGDLEFIIFIMLVDTDVCLLYNRLAFLIIARLIYGSKSYLLCKTCYFRDYCQNNWSVDSISNSSLLCCCTWRSQASPDACAGIEMLAISPWQSCRMNARKKRPGSSLSGLKAITPVKSNLALLLLPTKVTFYIEGGQVFHKGGWQARADQTPFWLIPQSQYFFQIVILCGIYFLSYLRSLYQYLRGFVDCAILYMQYMLVSRWVVVEHIYR